MYVASRVYASLANFAHWQNAPDLDLEAAYRIYPDKAIASDSRTAFSRASMAFLAQLRNAHTMFIDMPLIQQGGELPFDAEVLNGRWVITQTSSPGLKPGDVIENIDGRPFGRFVDDAKLLISASTEKGAQRELFARMPGFAPYAHLFPGRFELTLAGGRKVAINRYAAPATASLVTEGRWLEPGKVAYIRIPSFMSPQFEKRAIELAREYRHAEMLIVDVRGESGGSTPEDLTAFLMNKPYRFWSESTSIAMPYFRYRASQGQWQFQPFNRPDFVWPSTRSQPAKDNFTGKLALLVDAGCYSACEDFVMPFKDNHRALIMGETTGGSSGQPYTLDLGKGMMIMVGSKREIFPDGSQFEGVGIKPDVEMVPSIEDLKQSKDTVLEAARLLLAKDQI